MAERILAILLWWLGNLPDVTALWACLLVAHVDLQGFKVFREEDVSCDLLSV